MDHPAALHRIRVGVPATVEHSSEAGPETGKWVAETTQAGTQFYVTRQLTEQDLRVLLHSWMHSNYVFVPKINCILFCKSSLQGTRDLRAAKTGKAAAKWWDGSSAR